MAWPNALSFIITEYVVKNDKELNFPHSFHLLPKRTIPAKQQKWTGP